MVTWSLSFQILSIYFLVEVCLRIFALSPRNYFLRRGKHSCSRNNVVNWIDFVVVVISLILTFIPYYLRHCLQVKFYGDDEKYCQVKDDIKLAIANQTCVMGMPETDKPQIVSQILRED